MGFKNIIERFAVNYAHNTMQKSLYNGLNIDILDQKYVKMPRENTEYMLV